MVCAVCLSIFLVINFNPSLDINNHTPSKVLGEITVQPLKFENGLVISSHTLLGTRLLIHNGINP